MFLCLILQYDLQVLSHSAEKNLQHTDRCCELRETLPKQKAQEELVKIEMAKDAENKTKEDLFDLRMKILQELDPFESGAAELQLHHLEHNRQVMEKYLEE